MKKIYLFIFTFLLCCVQANAQSLKTQNLVVITLDGYRWQELFSGAERRLMQDNQFVSQDSAELADAYWSATPDARRKKLMPFFWKTIAEKGQIYGNRTLNNKVNVSNPYWFSYPGYNEIFTGFLDKRINSNGYPANPNTNVLEFINKQPEFQNQVAAFASWDAFPRILNEKRSDFPVNSGYEDVKQNLNEQPLTKIQKLLNSYQHQLPKYMGGERLDGSTYAMAMQYLKVNHPRVLYIGFGDPDELAHQGHYDLYLNSAHYIDSMISKLWDYLQSDPQYKDKTTLFITVDHGRGHGAKWTSHGSDIEHSDEIWFAVMGPDTPAGGEIKMKDQLYQKQFAQTMAHFLGLDFQADHPVGKPVNLW